MGDNDHKIKEIERIAKEHQQILSEYKKKLAFFAADAPIEALCLPKTTQTILINQGILRIYDLFNIDLGEIKGLGDVRCRDLTSRLNEFFAIC
jgi:hypothetical protein